MSALPPKTDRRRSWSAALSWVVVGVAVPASILLYVVIKNQVEDVARLRFEREVDNANAVIRDRLRSYGDVLYALRAVFATDEHVDRPKFHAFVKSLEVPLRYPGFVSLNYAVHVMRDAKDAFEATVRADTSLDPRGYPGFAIKPTGKRDEHFVLVYLEPMAGYEFAFGLDIGANPMANDPSEVAAAVRQHRDTGKLSASAQLLRVKREKEQIYLAMRLGVYRNGMPTDTVEQRRLAYIGSVGAGFDIEHLIREATLPDLFRNVRLRLFDVGSAADARSGKEQRRLLFDSGVVPPPQRTALASEAEVETFHHVVPIEFAGRRLAFEYGTAKAFVLTGLDLALPTLVLIGLLVSSVLVFGIFYSLSRSRSQALTLAEAMTADLRQSTEQLQAMSRRLVDLQESERRRFSRELHDQVGQNLTALSINLDILKLQLPPAADAELGSRLDDASSLVESTSAAIENVMSELRPPMLDDYGLLPALQWYAKQFADRTGIAVTVHGDEAQPRISQTSEIALFRIMQEALNNVAKHARAGAVEIALASTSAETSMTIADDGVGIEGATPGRGRNRPGLGMVTMRERIQAVGGEFDIGAGPQGGTRIKVRVPS